MKKLLVTTMLSFGLSASAAAPAAKDGTLTTLKNGTLILSDRNTVAMRMAFTADSVSSVVAQVLKKDKSLNKGEPIYLVLDTPGGSVGAGLDLIEALTGLDREIRTVTTFAASMGFITAQSLGKRYITETGVLMSHRARGGVQGQIPGELNVRAAFWTNYLKETDRRVAKRLGITADQLLVTHYDEWWISGSQSIALKAADEVIKVRCGQSLDGSYTQIVKTMFGNLKVEFSKCPLIKSPISIRSEISAYDLTAEESRLFKRAIFTMFYDKKAFLYEYVLTNRFSGMFQ